MSYFLTREDNARHPVGGKSMAGRPPPAPCAFLGNDSYNQAPSSPLSRLVQGNVQQSVGFDSAVAQDWQSSVHQTTAAHQQRNDPNYVEKKVKSNGYRVAQAPGGGSSISLSWDESQTDAPQALQRGRQDPAVFEGGTAGCLGGGAWNGMGDNKRTTYRDSSPNTFRHGVRASSRDSGNNMSACLGGGQMPSHPSSRGSMRESPRGMAACFGDMAYNSRAAPPFGNNAPPPVGGRRDALGRDEATSLSFGNRVDNGSSNAYACGSNQNVGNGITDRRTTRVLKPPGGSSQISFG